MPLLALLEHGELVEIGTPAALKARLGPDATLEDVFTARLPAGPQKEGRYADIRRERQAAREHG